MLKIHSITQSFSGEIGGFPQGTIVDIIRLAGCNIKCPYCDAKEACKKYVSEFSENDLYFKVGQNGQNILITGGEPLLQMKDIEDFIRVWSINTIQIETNGTIVPSLKLMNRIDYWVFDYKLDFKDRMIFESNEFLEALSFMKGKFYIKFVVASQKHMETSSIIKDTLLNIYRNMNIEIPIFAFSPLIPRISHKEVYEFITKNDPSIVLNCQLHKVLGKLENTIFS